MDNNLEFPNGVIFKLPIDVLSDLPDETQVFLDTSDGQITPAEIEVNMLLDKKTRNIDGVIIKTVLSEEMQRLIND
jgi:hypothetical protein